MKSIERHLKLPVAALVLGAALMGTPRPAEALQGGEDPTKLPTLVDKRFGMRGRHQISLMFSTSMVTKFVEGVGPYLAYQYNFSDLIGVEVGGAFFFGGETDIMSDIRVAFGTEEPILSDLHRQTWMANAALVITPVYGKISFASEFDPAFDMFLLAGGGAVGTERVTGREDQGTNGTVSTTTFNVMLGFGFRFYLIDNLAIRLEIRDYFYPEPSDALNQTRADGSPLTNDPAVADDVGGLTFNLHLQAGVQFQF